jgi:hypothetical protein
MNPRTVSLVGIPPRQSGWAGPTSRGFRAFTLPGIPGSPAGVNSPTAGCSLGLFPSRVVRRPALHGPSPALLPRAFAVTSLATSDRRRLGVSIGLRLALPTPLGKPNETGRTTLIGFLHRHDPDRSSELGSGLSCSPRAAPCVAADRPTLLRPNAPRSTSVARDSRKGQSPETAARWAGPSLRRREHRQEKR